MQPARLVSGEPANRASRAYLVQRRAEGRTQVHGGSVPVGQPSSLAARPLGMMGYSRIVICRSNMGAADGVCMHVCK